MQLYSVETGKFKLDGGAMFGVVPKSIWNKTNPADENNLCTWALRCLVIKEGDRTILIDFGTTPNIAPPSNLNLPVSTLYNCMSFYF